MNLIKFRYVPGLYPVPMIMMWKEANQEVFNEIYKYQFGEWEDQNQCIWTLGAYLIYDEEKIISYRFDDFSNLTWLLRSISKPLVIEIDKRIEKEILKHYSNEFELLVK